MARRTSLRVVNNNISLREKTTEVLRNAILNLTFQPGEKLVERKLCEETGVSRTSIREALRLLEAEGLLRREHNKGLCVNTVTDKEVHDIYEVRRHLEGAMLRSLADLGNEAVTVKMRKALKHAGEAANASSADGSLQYARALDAFAKSISDGAGNKVARDFLDSLSARMTYIRVLISQTATVEERRVTIGLLNDIVSAVEKHDAAAALKIFNRYIDRASQRAGEFAKQG